MRVEGRGCGTVDRCVARVSSGSRALALWRLLFLPLFIFLSLSLYLYIFLLYPLSFLRLVSVRAPDSSRARWQLLSEFVTRRPSAPPHVSPIQSPHSCTLLRTRPRYCSFPSGSVSPTGPNVGRRLRGLVDASLRSLRQIPRAVTALRGWGSRWKLVFLSFR